MSKDNGGFAFPKAHDSRYPDEQGMTLRQYYAGQAMQAFLMKDAILDDSDTSQEWLKKTAVAAYEMADAMLEAGKQ